MLIQPALLLESHMFCSSIPFNEDTSKIKLYLFMLFMTVIFLYFVITYETIYNYKNKKIYNFERK